MGLASRILEQEPTGKFIVLVISSVTFFLRFQKGTYFIIATNFCDQFTQICFHIGKVIRFHSSFEDVAGKHR